MSSSGDNDREWQERYQSLQLQRETELAAQQSTEKLLCRTIIRQTLSASGFNPQLDPHLNKLRDGVKKGVQASQLERLEQLSNAILHPDEPRATSQSGAADPFSRLLSRISLSASHNQALQRLVKACLAHPEGVSDQQLDQLLELISQPEAATKGKGLLGRLFARQGTSSDAGHEPNERLLTLLERLNWPEQMGQDIAHLKDRLSGAKQQDVWGEVLEDLMDLISAMLRDIQQEIYHTEGFLVELTDRLKEIDRHIQDGQDCRRESLESVKRFDQQVNDDIGSIHASVSGASSIQQLRSDVETHLNVLKHHMDSHIAEEMQLHEQAEHIELQLRDRLRHVELESEELRKKVVDAHQKATTDSVTGLPNRLAYDQRLHQEYVRWKRFGQPVSLLVWDIDDFKGINDRFGHRSGDKALAVIGNLLKQRLRETDFVARYGGEEFVMLHIGASLNESKQLAESIRQAIGKSGFHSNGNKVQVTISCGLTEFREGDTVESIFERADQAMYQAKGSGKNCCATL